ncbi:cell number regulator 8-like [Durio zibethinus]|uniref:Cell number regulator 8-like n=1 Tax=Durio zibethinus TaxID=66656 RepID=A0A6P6ARE3_DURZI|nr:cell number regulator 8-like [Durio zibethinus]
MANNNGSNNDDREESSPLLSKQVVEEDEKEQLNGKKSKEATAEVAALPGVTTGVGFGWTADGLPLVNGSVVGERMGRSQWDSSLLACLGRNDEFCSSDIEVCLLGSVVPCVLYGSNVERFGPSPGTFLDPCLSYFGLYLLGNSFFGSNCLAPCFSYPTRTAIRQKFNLEGTCEALHRSCGCCGSCVEDEPQREQCESACDFVTHFCCHACALCQEGRELRRRLPHPGFNPQPVLVMTPPGEQTMGRGA